MHKHKVTKVLFVPYAGVNLSPDGLKVLMMRMKHVLKLFLINLASSWNQFNQKDNAVEAVKNAECIAVGGGNTFHLVAQMQKTGIMEAIRKRAIDGMPYMGWSAGSNVACPTLKTTNDMPIYEPESFNCLNLLPFRLIHTIWMPIRKAMAAKHASNVLKNS